MLLKNSTMHNKNKNYFDPPPPQGNFKMTPLVFLKKEIFRLHKKHVNMTPVSYFCFRVYAKSLWKLFIHKVGKLGKHRRKTKKYSRAKTLSISVNFKKRHLMRSGADFSSGSVPNTCEGVFFETDFKVKYRTLVLSVKFKSVNILVKV